MIISAPHPPSGRSAWTVQAGGPIEQARTTLTIQKRALEYHQAGRPGKIQVVPTKSVQTARDLALAYTPGVAAPCLEIQKRPDDAYLYTSRGNLVAVVSNGTAVLGLGNLGRARRQARDGGQGRPVQALRGHRRVRHRARDRRPRADHPDREAARADLRRHQPGRHPRAGVLRDRRAADRGDGHPRLPRRPARHRDHQRRGVPERARCSRTGASRRRAWWWRARARRASPARISTCTSACGPRTC